MIRRRRRPPAPAAVYAGEASLGDRPESIKIRLELSRSKLGLKSEPGSVKNSKSRTAARAGRRQRLRRAHVRNGRFRRPIMIKTLLSIY